MTYKNIEYTDLFIHIQLAGFECENAQEYHAKIELNSNTLKTDIQFKAVETALERLQKSEDLQSTTLVWKRYFVSDAINQAPFITAKANEAVSVVQQAPLNGSKVSLFVYFVSDIKLAREADGGLVMERPNYKHLFHTQLHHRNGCVKEQTNSIFTNYAQNLSSRNYSVKDNTIRTWIYVQDVDVQYAGMVTARNECFDCEGLTPDTHSIASTGIEGRYIYPEVLMLMEAYSVLGIEQEQVKYLYAPTHLNPTHEYGVRFERGTSVDYADRRHIYISGTASINNKGEVVHVMDIDNQILRTIENIEELLKEADATLNDIGQMIVYLRDTADYQTVKKYFDSYHTQIPKVIVLAPVCRPGWLIEIECIAVKKVENTAFKPF